MIKSIHLKNFQCWEDLRIKFGNVTTIVGPSDTGKSAILRALGWVLLNKPRGQAFISEGETVATVVLRVDRKRVTRTKGKGNHYKLGKKKFTAFGNAGPDEVMDFLNVSEINFQGQHDSSFWFSQSAGQVSRELNSIVDLGLIDTTLANLAKWQRNERIEVGVIERRLDEARARRKKLKPARKCADDLQALDHLRSEAQSKAERATALAALLAEATRHRTTTRKLRRALRTGERVLANGHIVARFDHATFALEQLVVAAGSATVLAERKLPKLGRVTRGQREYVRAFDGRSARLRDLIAKYMNTEDRIGDARLTVINTAIDIGKVKRCPLCDQKIES